MLINWLELDTRGTEWGLTLVAVVGQPRFVQVAVVQLHAWGALSLFDVFETVVETLFDVRMLELTRLTQEEVVTTVATEISMLLQV